MYMKKRHQTTHLCVSFHYMLLSFTEQLLWQFTHKSNKNTLQGYGLYIGIEKYTKQTIIILDFKHVFFLPSIMIYCVAIDSLTVFDSHITKPKFFMHTTLITESMTHTFLTYTQTFSRLIFGCVTLNTWS